MNIKIVLLVVLLVGVFLVGCTSNSAGYATQNQQQGQYVGGGCGVVPQGAYENTPIRALDPVDSVL